MNTHSFISTVLLPIFRSLRALGSSFRGGGAAPHFPPPALEFACADAGGPLAAAAAGGPPRWAARLAELVAARESGLGGALLERLLRRGGGGGGGDGGAGGAAAAWEDAVWLAVPKRRTSYSKKRQRQMSPHYARKEITSFYPCPKCDKGLLKLRHHICPCDQVKLNVSGVKQVRSRRARVGEGGKGWRGWLFFFWLRGGALPSPPPIILPPFFFSPYTNTLYHHAGPLRELGRRDAALRFSPSTARRALRP